MKNLKYYKDAWPSKGPQNMNRCTDKQYIYGIKISWGREEQLGKKKSKKFLSGVLMKKRLRCTTPKETNKF